MFPKASETEGYGRRNNAESSSGIGNFGDKCRTTDKKSDRKYFHRGASVQAVTPKMWELASAKPECKAY